MAYRLVANCIEFLPHPTIPNPPDPSWVPQSSADGMVSQAARRCCCQPIPTRSWRTSIRVYLYGVIKQGAIWALDDDRAQQMDALWQQAITRANLVEAAERL